MYNMKGFLVVGALTDNEPGTVAKFGELSAEGMTYARDRGLYTDPDLRGVALVSFQSFMEDNPDETVEPTIPVRTNILTVGKWVNDSSENGVITESRDDFFALILQQFGEQIENITFGDILFDGQRYMPEWLSWNIKNSSGEADTRLKLWFADQSFRLQYDGFFIKVVPPLDVLDDFFKDPLEVKRLIEARDLTVTMDKVQEIRHAEPFTRNRNDVFDYNDPEDPEWKVPTNWVTLHYGEAGNNLDTIKEWIVKHILANSTHGREDWVKILPELFTSTEFVIIPMWTNYATENKTNQAGIYSPIMRHKQAKEIALLACKTPGYDEEHIDEYGSSVPFQYKSIISMVVGGPENRHGTFLLTDYVKDYINTPSGSIDFGRQTDTTREWVRRMEILLKAAETMTEFSDVPQGVNRLIRYGVIHAAMSYEKVQYLVVARKWLEEALATPPVVPLP